MQDTKTYLCVPYAQKDAAKALGAKWDPAKKLWYAPAGTDITLFEKWQTQPSTLKSPAATKGKPKQRTSTKNVVLGITTYGNNKDLSVCSDDTPPWD